MKFPTGRKQPKKYILTIDKFNGGSNSLLEEARMGKQFAVDATNLIQDQDGVWKTRWGSKQYGKVLEVEEPVVYDNGYSHRRLITINPTKIATCTNKVVYIDVIYYYLMTVANGGLVESASGYDIRFETINGNKLSHEILDWGADSGVWQGYVKIPSLSVSLNTFYIYYGNSSVVATEADPTNVFPTTLKAQYRFKDGALTTDSSGNTNTLTAIGIPVQATPRWGTGCVGLGTSQALSAVDGADFQPAGNFSVSAWIRTILSVNERILQSMSVNTNMAGFQFILLIAGTIRFDSGNNTGTTLGVNYERVTSTATVDDGAWHFIVGTYDGAKLHLYIDSVEQGTGTAWTNAAAFAATNYVRIGCYNDAGTNSLYFGGCLDETCFFPSNALSLAQVQSLYAKSINDADNAVIKALASAVYLFDDGGQLVDSSAGGGNTLTAIGTPTTCTTKFGGSIFLGNSSAYSAVDADVLKPTGNFTVGGWIKTTDTAVQKMIFSSYSQNTNRAGIYFSVLNNGTISAASGKNTGTTLNTDYKVIVGSGASNDNLWHFLVFVWDGSYLRIYRDGTSDATPVSWANAPVYADTNYVRVGSYCTVDTTTRLTFPGQLDDIFLLNGTALSADEILTEYNNSLPNYLGAGNEVIGYYNKIDGSQEFLKADGTTELISVCGNKVFKSVDGADWTEISGATFTARLQCYFMQIGGFLYIANGTDSLARYNGTVLTKYTALSTPTGLAASRVASGLTSGINVYYAAVTALNAVGETVGSAEASITTNKIRDQWTPATDKITWSWSTVSNALSYQLYISDSPGTEQLLTGVSAPTTNYTDDGSLTINPYVIPSLTDTTAAPKFKSMIVSGNRIWSTNNSNDKYKVYFSGTGQFLGNFSDFYGGGWINLEKGGREMPVSVKHYQTGQGEGSPTVLCNTPDGRGAVWQLSISTATVGSTSFSVPSAVKVVGSFGTESISGVVNTGNDIAFPNRKGWFSLGPQTGYFGLLRTSEKSSVIRPFWRNLVSNKVAGICSYFYDAKIFISVPTSSVGNDKIIIFDTERNNWAVSWSLGAKQFLDYTDTSGNTHFLYIPTSGTKLIELSPNYLNDLGAVFNQSYLSPLIPISEDKTDVFSLQEAVVELGRPQGSINFQLLGVTKDGSFSTIASTTITNFGSNTGIGTDLAGECYAGETQVSAKKVSDVWTIYLLDAPSVFAQSTTRKGIRKKSRLYAVQFKISSTTADTSFSILSIQARGTVISRRMPSTWLQ